MIKILKKQLYSLYSRLTLSKELSPIKIILYTSLFFIFYLAFPFYYIFKFKVNYRILFIFYSFLIFIIYYSINKFFKNRSYILSEIEELLEKINIKTDQIDKEIKTLVSLKFKINRYNSLKNIIQQINSSFDLESIADNLVEVAFNQIGRGMGVCLLYLIDVVNQRLSLCATKKEDPNLVIKAKQGDIFDKWVLRHAGALFIEDIKKDFRFDVDRIYKEHRRGISSLIGSPLISEEKMFGLIRLDSVVAQFFSEDDLRFLNTISDLGAVALENFELFEKTQELAIKDDLTSLYRKGYFLERLKEEFKRSLRRGNELSLLMMDIDHFKDYNDKFGHTAGDIVLREIAHTIIDYFKEDNVVLCRFGGEEFCVLLSDTKKKNASFLAERFRKVIQNKEIILRRQKTNVTVSIGLATYPADASNDEELLHKSDVALYQAKQKGRNRVCTI